MKSSKNLTATIRHQQFAMFMQLLSFVLIIQGGQSTTGSCLTSWSVFKLTNIIPSSCEELSSHTPCMMVSAVYSRSRTCETRASSQTIYCLPSDHDFLCLEDKLVRASLCRRSNTPNYRLTASNEEASGLNLSSANSDLMVRLSSGEVNELMMTTCGLRFQPKNALHFAHNLHTVIIVCLITGAIVLTVTLFFRWKCCCFQDLRNVHRMRESVNHSTRFFRLHQLNGIFHRYGLLRGKRQISIR